MGGAEVGESIVADGCVLGTSARSRSGVTPVMDDAQNYSEDGLTKTNLTGGQTT